MRRFRDYLFYSLIVMLGVTPVTAQTSRSDARPGAGMASMAGFGTAIVIGDGEILVSRTGVALLLPLLPSRTGGIHVFRPDAGTGVWEEVAHLTASDGDVGDGFGNAIAVDGNSSSWVHRGRTKAGVRSTCFTETDRVTGVRLGY